MVRYLGELYNYRMVESAVIFRVLYSFITFGVNYDGKLVYLTLAITVDICLTFSSFSLSFFLIHSKPVLTVLIPCISFIYNKQFVQLHIYLKLEEYKAF